MNEVVSLRTPRHRQNKMLRFVTFVICFGTLAISVTIFSFPKFQEVGEMYRKEIYRIFSNEERSNIKIAIGPFGGEYLPLGVTLRRGW